MADIPNSYKLQIVSNNGVPIPFVDDVIAAVQSVSRVQFTEQTVTPKGYLSVVVKNSSAVLMGLANLRASTGFKLTLKTMKDETPVAVPPEVQLPAFSKVLVLEHRMAGCTIAKVNLVETPGLPVVGVSPVVAMTTVEFAFKDYTTATSIPVENERFSNTKVADGLGGSKDSIGTGGGGGGTPPPNPPSSFPPAGTRLGNPYNIGANVFEDIADGSGGYATRPYTPPPPPPNYPARGTLLGHRCAGYHYMAIIADGNNGQYEEVAEANNVYFCGYSNQPAHPPFGTVMSAICSGTTLIKIIANGDGTTQNVGITNSVECGYNGGGPGNLPAGTKISMSCSGVDSYAQTANGNGGTVTGLNESNSSLCNYGGSGYPAVGAILFTQNVNGVPYNMVASGDGTASLIKA